MTSLFSLVVLAAIAVQDASHVPAIGPIPEAGHSTIGYATVEEALTVLRQKPDAKFSERDGWTIVQEAETGQAGFAFWSFTPPGHPAHPAVAKRSVFEKNGSVWIDLAVHCEAAKEPCDQLVRDFQELNERIKGEASKR